MTLTVGTPFQVNSSGTADTDASQLDSNNAIVVHQDSLNKRARIIQADETVGAEYSFSGLSNGGNTGIAVGALSSTKALSLRRASTGCESLILSVSGTVITSPGSDVNLGGLGAVDGLAAVGISATEAITILKDDNNSNRGQANYLTVSGTTITDASSVIFEASAGSGIEDATALVKLSSTKAIAVYIDADDSSKLKAVTLTVSGGNISAGSPTTIDDPDHCDYPSLAPIDSTSCLLVYQNVTDTDVKACVLSSPSTTITAGSLTTLTTTNGNFTTVSEFSATSFVAFWKNTADTAGKMMQLAVSGTTVTTVGSVQEFDATTGSGRMASIAYSGTQLMIVYHASVDAAMITPGITHLWLSADGAAIFADIGDSAWGANVVGGVVVVPGTAYQTIFTAVGTSLYKTINGGTAWTLETAVGYEVDFIDLEKDNTTVFLAKRDAAGTNRASLWDSVGASLTHINTGKSTTGGATSGSDVV